jgi:hypothetical protein
LTRVRHQVTGAVGQTVIANGQEKFVDREIGKRWHSCQHFNNRTSKAPATRQIYFVMVEEGGTRADDSEQIENIEGALSFFQIFKTT